MTHRPLTHVSTPFARLAACILPSGGLVAATTGQRTGGRRRMSRFALVALLCMSTLAGVASTALPAALAASLCPTSEADIANAVSAAGSGGTVTLSCTAATTISFSPNATGTTGNAGTGTMAISQSVTLDASQSPQPIALDGNKDTRLFSVSTVTGGSSVTFGVKGLTLQNGHKANDGGGAIADNGSTLTVTNSTFRGNSATSDGSTSYGGGGAIFNQGYANVTVTNSTFAANSATTTACPGCGGGAIYNYSNSGTLTVTNSTFAGNSAGDGGAIDTYGGRGATVTNSTFAGNSAGDGGAIYTYSSAVTATNSTFSGNSASSGGAIFTYYGGGVWLGADIIANSPSGGNCLNNQGTITDNGYNVDTDGTCTSGKTGDTSAAPNLGPLANNGGPTQTFALLAGSPAIDAVSQAQCPATDQRSASRLDNAESSCDIGAYEYVEANIGCPTSTALASAMANVPSYLETLELQCSGPTTTTISFSGAGNSGTITVAKSVLLDGSQSSGAITLDGGYNGNPNSPTGVELFAVNNSAVNFGVNGLTLQNGDNTTGGAITNNGALTLTNSTFSGNAVTSRNGNAANGGGAITNNGMLTVTNSTFSGNATSGYTGGAILNGGTLTVTNSTFSGNATTANGNGGGAIFNYGTLTVTNSTFSGNSTQGPASGGGALGNGYGGTVTVTNSTFSGNSSASGGAIWTYKGAVNLSADIVANSPSGGNCSISPFGGTLTDSGYNLDSDGSCTSGKTGDTSTAPNLGPLDANGGPTQTFALPAGSPAVDAIPTSSGLCPATDQRGAPRLDNSESSCDIGAYEYVEKNIGCPTYDTLSSAIANTPSYLETLELACPTPTTISFDDTNGTFGTITVPKSVTLDAGQSLGAITLDGGYNGDPNSPTGLELFQVNSGATFGVNGLTLSNGYSQYGGAIFNYGTLTVTNSTLNGNVAGSAYGGNGGAIDNEGTLTVTNSTFSGNAAPSGAGGGGAIINEQSGTLTVSNSTFSGNMAALGGAINNGGTLTVTSSTFSGNGGAIYNDSGSGTATVSNSTFSGNSATGGGAIENYSPLTVTNSTFSGNSATVAGGAIDNSNSTVTLEADIIVNSPAGGNCSVEGGSITDDGYNLSDDATCGFSDGANHDLVVGAGQAGLAAQLASNGGATQTLALLPKSPAIGAGNPAVCGPSGILGNLDQRGSSRHADTRTACDIGAYDTGGAITIAKGWTLIGDPLASPSITTASAVVSSLTANGQLGNGTVTALATSANGAFHLYVPGYTADQPLTAFQGIFVLSTSSGQWNPWTTAGATAYSSGQVQVHLQPGWNLVYTPYPYRGLNGDGINAEIGTGGTTSCGLQEVATNTGGSYQVYTPSGPTGYGFHVPSTAGMWIECTNAATWTPT